ncbi:MAG: 3-hydroxybutyrate dehydrogenase [Hoeflea sp.]|uniref:3-hydroxybutyrate dehydrogenase n=1 Tax=Hoeflea sp. TaxID=1940281 RepID=UPI001DB40C00|nr:3-hydroxybutyrate dehydrogenase [Hoeflea sp.]MBU4527669.1 3-hydroxybutyrate dehydrogenase [Alphaproteobacteria bacterium]MBU4546463.1 3-hydroxybutyrate dehydrogenase [Alphaproteobacteria bacterium]MBU4553019.1 3-hydroxybutyrate dehydrogenase [Alphaproteobacteria bacterium]MBV1724091.1 3-hydroxybutyrate dehydrogenase [Hoeflea sp.]MBV1759776.1 3-hydroxybutyrate dehydrogenase [Hoeflea sp.]
MKTIIITGSTSGIGLGIAENFASAGYNVVLNGLGKPDEIEATRARVADLGAGEVIFHGANMLKPDEITDLVKTTRDKFGSVDVIIPNAGIQHVEKIEDFPLEKWDAIIAINLSSAFHLIRAAMPIMKQQEFGRIIAIASAHGLVASPFKSSYVAAKHGIVGLMKTVALEGAEFGVTANAICPGYVETPLVSGQIADTAKARGMSEEDVISDVILKAQPTKQFVTVEQIASLALFLASDQAAQITGAALPMDGGWTAQ